MSNIKGPLRVEAMRIARRVIKGEMKRQGLMISSYEPSEITKAAKELLAADGEIVKVAKANLEKWLISY